MNTLSSAGENAPGRSVAVLGASPNPERYSHMAVTLLKSVGFPVIPIHPTAAEINGVPAVKSLADIRQEVHTLSLYVGPKRLPSFLEDIVRLHPQRVIFNPGTESAEATDVLGRAGIECVEGCTLVMLKTAQF
jgi:predicted CoA-binding protein